MLEPTARRICIFLMFGACFVCAKNLCAQKRSAYILETAPAPEAEGPYRISFSTSAKALTVSFPLRGSHAINLRAEYFRSASVPKAFELAHLFRADWKFRSVPVTASYTYALPSPASWIFPVAGVGLSAHVYRQTEKIDRALGVAFHSVEREAGDVSEPYYANTRGLNFGAEASLGFIVNLGDHMFMMSQWRYRYVACPDHRYGYNYNSLNVLDFSMDFGFQF